jgi:hypothetical protein
MDREPKTCRHQTGWVNGYSVVQRHRNPTKSRGGAALQSSAAASSRRIQSSVLGCGSSSRLSGYRPLRPPQTDWRATHAVDPGIRTAARAAADRVATLFRPLHARSFKLNVMLTVNLDDIARRLNTTPDIALERVMQTMRNQFRRRGHHFAGFWRREFASPRNGGNHCHILFHAPRGIWTSVSAAMARLTRDTVAARPRLNVGRPQRCLAERGASRTWHLRRITNLPGLLDYISKVPVTRDGRTQTRQARLKGHGDRVKEFRSFGMKTGDV